MASEMIIVDSAKVQECVSKYKAAEDKLEEAVSSLEKAVDALKSDWTGRAIVAMAAAVAVLVLKIRKSIARVNDATEELNFVAQKTEETESTVTKRMGSLDVGEASAFNG